MKILIGLLVMINFLFSGVAQSEDNEKTIAQGKTLYQSQCVSCHGLTGGMDMKKRLAPPIIAVKMHYKSSYSDQDSFVNAIVSWVKKPDVSHTMMPGAIKKFGIMPAMKLKPLEIEQIASYIFKGQLDKPEGFDHHFEEMHGKKGKGKHKKHH